MPSWGILSIRTQFGSGSVSFFRIIFLHTSHAVHVWSMATVLDVGSSSLYTLTTNFFTLAALSFSNAILIFSALIRSCCSSCKREKYAEVFYLKFACDSVGFKGKVSPIFLSITVKGQKTHVYRWKFKNIGYWIVQKLLINEGAWNKAASDIWCNVKFSFFS